MIFEMPGCGGCRTCELACSFHHTKEFNPEASSIRIMENKGYKGYSVLFVEKGEGNPCDGCKGLEQPLCLEYCEKSDELKKMIEVFCEGK